MPYSLVEMMTTGDQLRTDRVMTVLLSMKKIDLERLQGTYDGDGI